MRLSKAKMVYECPVCAAHVKRQGMHIHLRGHRNRNEMSEGAFLQHTKAARQGELTIVEMEEEEEKPSRNKRAKHPTPDVFDVLKGVATVLLNKGEYRDAIKVAEVCALVEGVLEDQKHED